MADVAPEKTESGFDIKTFDFSTFDEIQLQLVAKGVRPACLYMPPALKGDAECAGPLRDRALELGLSHIHFPGVETKGWERETRRLSGHLYYSEELADAGDIAYLKEHGWSHTPEGSQVTGRVLGYDHWDYFSNPVLKTGSLYPSGGTISIVLRQIKKSEKGRSYVHDLWWYNVKEMDADTVYRAAKKSNEIRRVVDDLWRNREGILRAKLKYRPEVYIETKFRAE